jgi:hypothetical protein
LRVQGRVRRPRAQRGKRHRCVTNPSPHGSRPSRYAKNSMRHDKVVQRAIPDGVICDRRQPTGRHGTRGAQPRVRLGCASDAYVRATSRTLAYATTRGGSMGDGTLTTVRCCSGRLWETPVRVGTSHHGICEVRAGPAIRRRSRETARGGLPEHRVCRQRPYQRPDASGASAA